VPIFPYAMVGASIIINVPVRVTPKPIPSLKGHDSSGSIRPSDYATGSVIVRVHFRWPSSNLPPLIAAGTNVARALDVDCGVGVDFPSPLNRRLLGIHYCAGARRVCPADLVLTVVLLYVEIVAFGHFTYSHLLFSSGEIWERDFALQ
jgi:hypothetical protein